MTSTDVAIQERDTRPPMVVLRDRLQAREAELRAALGPDIPVATFVRAVMTSVALNPDILACSWQSIWNSCLKACRDGLIPDGQDAAIVPFKNTAQYIAMYQGMLRRFRRSGQFHSISANLVRQGEEFSYYIDEDGEHLHHVPGGSFSAPIEKIYARAKTKDGGIFIEVMSIAEANKIRSMSRTTREDSPWKQWPEQMYRKTALRRLCKYLPQARDLLPDEELPEIEAPSAAPELPAAEQKSIETASPQSDTPTAPGEAGSGGAQDNGGQDTSATSGTGSAASTADAPAAAAADASDPVAAAYERGRADKAKGVQRRALPGEYRDPSATRLALAWQAGIDGLAMPSFGAGESKP